jgi:hypothetical protein
LIGNASAGKVWEKIRLDLLLQIGDLLLLGGMIGWPLLLEGNCPILEEILLSTAERLLHFHLNRNRTGTTRQK